MPARRGFEYRPVLSEPDPRLPGARIGHVHAAVLEEVRDLSAYDVYASGPPAMIEAIRAEFLAAGLPREQLHFDSFDYAPDTLARLAGRGVPA